MTLSPSMYLISMEYPYTCGKDDSSTFFKVLFSHVASPRQGSGWTLGPRGYVGIITLGIRSLGVRLERGEEEIDSHTTLSSESLFAVWNKTRPGFQYYLLSSLHKHISSPFLYSQRGRVYHRCVSTKKQMRLNKKYSE